MGRNLFSNPYRSNDGQRETWSSVHLTLKLSGKMRVLSKLTDNRAERRIPIWTLGIVRYNLLMGSRLALFVIIWVYCGLVWLYALNTPHWEVPDEPAHFN